jgi:hypothetical protein
VRHLHLRPALVRGRRFATAPAGVLPA